MAGSNIYKLEIVAKGFGDLAKEVVFIGGAVAELYADAPIPEEIRTTEDVDVVVKIVSKIQFNKFEEKIRRLGFKNDVSEGAPVCRWIYNGIKVDVMPVESSVLGFGNIWYEKGFENREIKLLSNGIEVYVFPLMIYMATKLEAVKDRGLPDLRISHDFEDIIYLLDNCSRIKGLCDIADKGIKIYLTREFKKLKQLTVFREAVFYSLPYGSQDERVVDILEMVDYIASL